eukprot:18803-Pelagococcus_subviridis.AAC.2
MLVSSRTYRHDLSDGPSSSPSFPPSLLRTREPVVRLALREQFLHDPAAVLPLERRVLAVVDLVLECVRRRVGGLFVEEPLSRLAFREERGERVLDARASRGRGRDRLHELAAFPRLFLRRDRGGGGLGLGRGRGGLLRVVLRQLRSREAVVRLALREERRVLLRLRDLVLEGVRGRVRRVEEPLSRLALREERAEGVLPEREEDRSVALLVSGRGARRGSRAARSRRRVPARRRLKIRADDRARADRGDDVHRSRVRGRRACGYAARVEGDLIG